MPEPAQTLPPAVQRTVDAANRAAHAAGLKNAPPVDEQQASPNAMQAGLEASDQAPEPKEAPEPAPKAEVVPIDWERRYKAMKGQYDAEIPRMKAEMDTLRLQISQAQAAPKPQAPQPDAQAGQEPTSQEKWYSPEQLEDFGQDFFDLVDKRVGLIERKYGDALNKLEQENARLNNHLAQLGEGVQKVQQAPLFTVLDKKIPEWKQLNSDPAFLAWAKETPVSDLDDRSMLEALRIHFKHGRANPVAGVFQAYIDHQSQGNPDQTRQPTPDPVPGAQQGSQPPAASASFPGQAEVRQRVSMDSLAGPGTPHEAGSDPLIATPQHRLWTDATIAQFYDGVSRGTISREDANTLEADLQQAITPQGRRDGRYRPR